MRSIKEKILQITAFTVVGLFMNFAVLAQTQEGSKKDTTKQDNTSVNEQTQTSPQEQNLRSDEMRSQDHDQGVSYSDEVEKNNLPQEVNSSLKELYPAHQVEEVHQGDDDSYRIKVKNKSDEAYVYYDSDGSFLRARNISEGQSAFPQQQSQSTRGWGTDQSGNQQGAQGSQWGTGSQSQGTQQGTQGSDRGLGTQGTQQGNQGMNRGSSTQGQDTYQRSQQDTSGTLGTGTDTTSQKGDEAAPQEQNQRMNDRFGTQSDRNTGSDRNRKDASDIQGSSQGTLENWNNKSQDNESSAYPQSQNQRSDDRLGTGSSSDMNRDFGNESSTQSDAQRGRLGSHGSINQSGIGSSQDTTTSKGEFGSVDHSTTTTQGQYGAGQETETRNNQSAFPQSQSQRGEDDGDVDYSEEIEESELPDAVSSSLEELYPEHDIDKVFRGDDDSFKVKVKNENDEAVIYYNSNGDFIKAKNLNENDK